MNHKVEFMRRTLKCIYEMLFVCILVAFIKIIILKENVYFSDFLWIAVILLVSHLARSIVVHYGLLSLIHMVIICIIFFLPMVKSITVILVALTIYAMFEANTFVKRGGLAKLDDIPWPTFFICIIVNVYGIFTHSALLTGITSILSIVMVFVYLAMLYTEGLKGYLDATKDVSGLPLKRIISTNTMIVIGIMTILLFSVVLGEAVGVEELLYKSSGVIKLLIKAFATIILAIATFVGGLFSTDKPSEIPKYELLDDGDGIVINSVGDSFEIILKIFLLLLAVYILYRIAYKVIRMMFMSRKVDGDIIEVASIKRNDTERKVKFTNLFGIKLSPEEKARKLYKTKINRYRYDIKLNQNLTCREIEKQVRENEIGDVEEITQIYSDIRYGTQSVDKSILKKMNKLSRQ